MLGHSTGTGIVVYQQDGQNTNTVGELGWTELGAGWNNYGAGVTRKLPLVPEDADYWGILFMVKDKNLSKGYSVLIKKSECPSINDALLFAQSEPLDYLKTVFLDNFMAGSNPMVWPRVRDGWVVM